MEGDSTPVVSLIGYGVMAEAIIVGLSAQGVIPPDHIRASGPRTERGDLLRERYGIVPYRDNAAAVRGAGVVILSVKPQRLEAVITDLRGQIDPGAVVLSIVAGATLGHLAAGLNHHYLVRAMPNTPAQIGEGITVWTASSQVTQPQLALARQILQALGEEVFVEDENYLDMATALSGTGPAYVFLFMEALIDAGVHLGFPRRIAEQLVVQTVRGSVDYYRERQAHPAALRNDVTSPGGTSAAALYYLEKAGFRTALSRAVWAAYERSVELGKGQAVQPPEHNDL